MREGARERKREREESEREREESEREERGREREREGERGRERERKENYPHLFFDCFFKFTRGKIRAKKAVDLRIIIKKGYRGGLGPRKQYSSQKK